jgi:hypothetical protein
MENEFWITVELLSLGGNISLMVIPRRRHFELHLDDQEVGRIYKHKQETWLDIDEALTPQASEIIGQALDLQLLNMRVVD